MKKSNSKTANQKKSKVGRAVIRGLKEAIKIEQDQRKKLARSIVRKCVDVLVGDGTLDPEYISGSARREMYKRVRKELEK